MQQAQAPAQAAQNQARQPVPSLPQPRAGYSFPARQTLTYQVDWRVFPAGTVVMHLEGQGNEEHVTSTADTLGAINLIFRVVDRFQSSFDRQTGCSSGFSKQLQEGRRQVNSDLKFDYQQHKMIQNERNVVRGTSRHQEASIPSCVIDLLSAIFYPSSQALTVGQNFQVPVADGMRTIPVTMKMEGREQVHTPLGTYQTIRVQPTADAGVVKNRGNIWIWYTDDDRHIPVQMRARLFWGTITFQLTALEDK
ncbi:DUF3108 domain-containing protein [Acidipila sp. 4G-K13]|uniref:DUF3108 domain-containing protein n=1 Tax=Paracidobacterium acidisoli TaxID=2303751 RepID=A0A372IJB4_9BACT|nr:DUF3108 domain-containing protein [Paracidobacterium acidisoli]